MATSDRLLLRAPLMANGGFDLSRFECGHPRPERPGAMFDGPFYQHCAECAKIPHPRTNPRGYPIRGDR